MSCSMSCSVSNGETKADWQQLRPRAVKLINSVCPENSERNVAATAARFTELGFPWREDEAMNELAKLFVTASLRVLWASAKPMPCPEKQNLACAFWQQ